MKNKLILQFLLFILCFVPTFAQVIHPDSAYIQQDYLTAIKEYEKACETNATLKNLYNLGNAYYKTNNLGKAILNYERAKMLDPSDSDVKHNLEICRSKMLGNENQVYHNSSISDYIKYFVMKKSSSEWGIWGIISLIIYFSLKLMRKYISLIDDNTYVYKISKVLLPLTILFLILFIGCSYWEKNDSRAVVIKKTQVFHQLPAVDSNQTIHPGTIIFLTDEKEAQLSLIIMEDGTKGWIDISHVEKIVKEKN